MNSRKKIPQGNLGAVISLFVAALLSCSACGKNNGDDISASRDDAAGDKAVSAPPLDPADVKVAKSVVGLEKLMSRVMSAVNEPSRKQELDALLYSLRLPEYETWFKKRFPRDIAKALAEEYEPFHDDIGLLRPILIDLSQSRQTVIKASSYGQKNEAAESPAAKALPFATAEKEFRLYSARFSDSGDKRAFNLWYFVFEDGSFRYIGKLASASPTS